MKTCYGNCSSCFTAQADAATETDFEPIDGLFIKAFQVPAAGTHLIQHSHVYEHATLVACGSVRLWMDDEMIGEWKAPNTLVIPAGRMHRFESLEPNTVLYCIHNTSRSEGVVAISPGSGMKESASCQQL